MAQPVVFIGLLVLLIQAGFALLQTGMSRAKNSAHTMALNLLGLALTGTALFVCGFALANGPGLTHARPAGNVVGVVPAGDHSLGLLGTHGFFLAGFGRDQTALLNFIYLTAAIATAAAIPLGACVERWSTRSFALFILCATAIPFPIYACWMWSDGWLARLGVTAGLGHGAVDFAGSSVIHLQGGAVALTLCWLVRPRIGKYDTAGRPRPIFGHHMPMIVLGTLLLSFALFGLVAGHPAGAADDAAPIVVNLILASSASTLAAATYMWKFYGKPDVSIICNGMLGGIVSISGVAPMVGPATAFFIGAVTGILIPFALLFLERRGIDDPVGAISIHGVSGLWGMLAVGLFADGSWGDGLHSVAGGVSGLLAGGHSLGQLFVQCIAALVCIAWAALSCAIIYNGLERMAGPNRVGADIEIAGLDVPELGVSGYPEFTSPISGEQVSIADLRSPM